MPPDLPQLEITTESDVLLAHDIAMQLSNWAGVPAADRIRFAATIADCCSSPSEKLKLQFNLSNTEDNHFLQAIISNSGRTIERKFRQSISHSPSTPFSIKQPLHAENPSVDMEKFSHELKNSLTKLKLALSLIDSEPVPESVNHYLQIIHRATERLESAVQRLKRQ